MKTINFPKLFREERARYAAPRLRYRTLCFWLISGRGWAEPYAAHDGRLTNNTLISISYIFRFCTFVTGRSVTLCLFFDN